MTIKSKLIIISALICSILGALAVAALSSYRKSSHQVYVVRASLNDLYAVSKMRSAIIDQAVQSMHYLLAGKVEDKQKYKEMGVIVRKVQAEWIDAAKESMALGLSRKGEMERAHEIARAYNKAEETVAAAFELLDGGKRLEAYRLLEDKVEFWINRVLSKKLDEAVAKETREASETYDEVLIRLGSIPWGGKNSIEPVQNARFSMQSFIAVNKIGSGIRKEYKELIDYLLSGEEKDMKELEEYAGEAEAALKDWIMAIQVQTELGRSKRRELLNNAMEMDKKHGAFMELAHNAFELERAGKREELSGFIENKIKPYVNDLLLSQLSKERDHARKEIDNANQKLLDITFAAGVKAVVMLTIVSLIIIVVVISIMRGIMLSLNKLRMGTEIIGTGVLEHRIGLKTKDELGQLASAFDRMTEALQKSRDEIIHAGEYTDNILRSMSDTLFVVSPNGLIQTVNDALCTLLGYGKNELIGRPVDEILDEGPLVKGMAVADIAEKGDCSNIEKRYLARDGRKITVLFASSLIRNNTGPIGGTVCVAQDITERKQAEESLRASETKFRSLSREFHTLLDAIPDSLVLLSPDLKVLWSNKSAANALKKDGTDPDGQRCYTLWHGRSSVCEACPVVKSFRSGKEEELQLSTPDGKFWDVRAFPVKAENGKVRSVIEVSVDITEKRTLQAEAMQAAHLASLGELAAGVAHEINNPINGIINYAQILIDESGAESGSGDIANRILKDGDRIANIVRSLLSFARAGKNEKSAVRISELLADVLALTGTQLRKESIKITVDIPEDLPEIIAHPKEIEQVFLNIINNARYALNRKYQGAHRDKSLEVTGERVIVKNCPYVRITFHDHGTGIPDHLRDKVVAPFFSTKPKGVGTGLGLSISHGIINDHGGSLKIDSIEGKFTKVIIDLPEKGEG
ncbi:MAG: PAS domain-containing protein [Desulfobacteria bacterium]